MQRFPGGKRPYAQGVFPAVLSRLLPDPRGAVMNRLLFPILLATFAVASLSLPAMADTRTYEDQASFDFKRGGELVVEAAFLDVEVSIADISRVEVEVYMKITASGDKAEKMIEEYTPRYSEKGDRIVITSKQKKKIKWGGWSRGTRTEGWIKVRMPAGMGVVAGTASGDIRVTGDLGEHRLECDTASGDVILDAAMDRLDVDTASGEVRAELRGRVRSVNIDTASGDVEIRGGATEDIEVDTASGDIVAEGLTGRASFDTASGDVRARWNETPRDVDISVDTASGDARLWFPEDTRLSGWIDVASGDIDCDFPGRSSDRGRHFTFDGDSRDVRVEIDTASGDVAVLRR